MRLVDRTRAETRIAEETRGKEVYVVTTHTDANDEPDGITVYGDYGAAVSFFRMVEDVHGEGDGWKLNAGYSFGPKLDGFGSAFGLRRWTDENGNYVELRLFSTLPMVGGQAVG